MEEEKGNLINKINSLMQSKQYLENDLEDFKWNLSHQKESTEEIEKQLRDKNNEMIGLQGNIMELQKEIEGCKLTIGEL